MYVDMDFNPTSRILACASTALPGQQERPKYTAYSLENGRLVSLGTKAAPSSVANILKLRFLAKGGTEFISGMSCCIDTLFEASFMRHGNHIVSLIVALFYGIEILPLSLQP